MKRSLNGEWMFRERGTSEWAKAEVPGCNFLDLLALKKIPEPFFGRNESKVRWVAERDWEYRRTFFVSKEEMLADAVFLQCERLDTLCDVFINETLVGHGENCHLRYCFSVKNCLSEGENELRIVFFSPVAFAKQCCKEGAVPPNFNGQNGIVFLRKPQYHFGWDWGPILPPSGISGEIGLAFAESAKISELRVTQKHREGTAELHVEAATETFGSEKPACVLSVRCPDGSLLTEQGAKADFVIDSPELWWTYELSGKRIQPLYTVTAELFCGEKKLDRTEKNIGLRTVELSRDRDAYGSNFQFVLNGVPLFIKGADLIPPDFFLTRFSEEKQLHLLEAARFSNMNMIRIWGGGFYGSDALYDACDRYGILVWQDFCFACQAYPFFDAHFRENVLREVEDNVKRICSHPSLALWCGNNEIEEMQLAWCYLTKYVRWTEKFFYELLEPEIRKNDQTTPYVPGSPCGASFGKGVDSDNVGDTHLWAVWHGLKPMTYYRLRMTRFCSEFGFESLPDPKTVAFFADPSEKSLSEPVFSAHQKCKNGNDKILYYIASRFELPANFKDLIYLSQITQQECVRDATEHWRRKKGRCNGALYWQFNDCWPGLSWSSMDYFGRYKALQYTARVFNAPLAVSAEDTPEKITVYVLNDLNSEQKAEVSAEIFDFEKGVLSCEKKDAAINALENRALLCMDVQDLKKRFDPRRTGVALKLFQNGELLMQRTVLFAPERKLHLPKCAVKCSVERKDDMWVLHLRAEKYIRLLQIGSDSSEEPFSDNYFDLMPGQEKEVTQKAPAGAESEKEPAFTFFSCADVVPDRRPLRRAMARAKVYCSFLNLANSIHNSKIPKDCKLND